MSAERKTRGPADGLRLKRYADKLAPAFSTVHPPPVLLPAFSQCGTIVRFAQPWFWFLLLSFSRPPSAGSHCEKSGCRHPLLFAVLDLLVLLDQAKSTRNSVRRKTSDRFFGKYPAPSIRRFPARSRFTTFLLHNTVYEFAARTYYLRRISKSGSDTPLTLHYGIALSVIITAYIPMNRL